MKCMQTHRSFLWFLVVAAFLLVLSSILLVWVLLPVQVNQHEILIDPFEPVHSGDSQNSYYYPVLNKLSFSWPEEIKLGGQSEITLNIEGEESDQENEYPQGSRKITEDYNVVFEARLDLSFAALWPLEEIKKPVNVLQSTDFEWQVIIEDMQDHTGNLWVYINFVPKNGGETIRKALSAVPIEVKTTSLFGISMRILKWIIPAGYFASIVLSGFWLNRIRKT